MIRSDSRKPIISLLASAMLSALVAMLRAVDAGEGGTSHVLPGANATLADLPPTAPGWFFKPMFEPPPVC
jgi:hypothetical protein